LNWFNFDLAYTPDVKNRLLQWTAFIVEYHLQALGTSKFYPMVKRQRNTRFCFHMQFQENWDYE